MEKLMLKVENLSKIYKLGQIGGTTLRDELQRLNAKIHGKEDPTRKIGARNYNNGETFQALDNVSFDVKRGERIGIIGHNGAGKSTLLKLISRITAPSGGSIGLNGRVASMLEVGTGFHGELTGRENIYMNGAILGMTKKEIDSKIESIIEFSECRQFIDTPVKRYSSGMFVKLAFAVVAHLDEEIMIMDEVLAVGDMAFQRKCLDKMNEVSRSEGRTILYVSHNMNTIRELCDRVVVLDHGKLIYDGEVEEGIAKYIGASREIKTSYVYPEERQSGELYEKRPAVINGIDVLDRNTNVLERGELLRFVMHCKTHKKTIDCGIRLEIKYNNSVIGAAFSDKSFTLEENTCFDAECTFDTSTFAPAVYEVNALLFLYGGNGVQRHCDQIQPAMFFEIRPNHKTDQLIWQSRFWGHVHYDDIKILDLKILRS